MLRTCFKWPMFFIGAMVAGVFFLHLKAPPTILHPSGWMQRFQRHRKDMIPSDDHEDWVVGIGAAECQY